MAINEEVEWNDLNSLYLDPKNPRLGRHFIARNPSQDEVLDQIKDWTLDELAVSFLESGFWTQEALVITSEKIGRSNRDVVIEGNRRLAALKLLDQAAHGEPVARKWKNFVKDVGESKLEKLRSVPCIRADSRKEVQAYLGFRHVSGIKEWNPAEKAEFIAHLIDDEKLTYEQVMRKIGSKTPTVRQNYIAYRLLNQMETEASEISIEHVESRFSVLYLSLRTPGTQKYLQINLHADPKEARHPVPRARLPKLQNFALWLFGDDERSPVLPESRDIDAFGRILESTKAIEYLERTERPSFAAAYRLAGGDEPEVVKHLDRAADEVEEALRTVHRHKKSPRVREASKRLGEDVMRLLEIFPDVKADIFSESD